eukprot:SAG22_NODE_1256_length_4995_cov_4.293096_3_plen_316_part_00
MLPVLALLMAPGLQRAGAGARAQPPGGGLGPTASGLYDCALTEDLGCFDQASLKFPLVGSRSFCTALQRDGSVNPLTGTTLERCAQFCTLNWFTLSAVSTTISPTKRCSRSGQCVVDANSTCGVCSCGNRTSSGTKLASAACSAPPAGGNYSAPPAGCLAGSGSCPCGANASQACGMPGVSRVYRTACTPAHGPGRYLCPLRGGRYMENGSDVSYQTWVDCFGQAVLEGVPTLGVPVIMSNSHYAVAPHYALLCNMTKDPRSWYCAQAVASLEGFAASPTSSATGYHAYEPLLAYQAVVDAVSAACSCRPPHCYI